MWLNIASTNLFQPYTLVPPPSAPCQYFQASHNTLFFLWKYTCKYNFYNFTNNSSHIKYRMNTVSTCYFFLAIFVAGVVFLALDVFTFLSFWDFVVGAVVTGFLVGDLVVLLARGPLAFLMGVCSIISIHSSEIGLNLPTPSGTFLPDLVFFFLIFFYFIEYKSTSRNFRLHLAI